MPLSHAMSGSAGRLPSVLLVLAAIYIVINFGLTTNHPYPLGPDDFTILGGSIADMGLSWKRPVAANVIFLMGEYGPAFSYLLLSGLVVVSAWMVLVFLGKVFAIRLDWVLAVVFGTMVFSHVSAFVHSKYLGLITNLASHTLGLASLLLLWHAWHDGRRWQWLLAGLMYLLSVFAKEDFILPPLVLMGFLWIGLADSTPLRDWRLRPDRWLASLALIAICCGSLAWSAYDHNPFVAGLFSPGTSSASYAVDLHPSAIARAYWKLMAGFAPVASASAATACVGLWIAVPHWRLKVMFFIAMIAVLVLPYSLIPNNMPPARAYAWLPWLGGIVAVGLQAWAGAWAQRHPVRGRATSIASLAAVAIALLVAWSSEGERDRVGRYYQAGEGISRRMIESLEAHRQALDGEQAVGLHGLTGQSPWCGNDALYVNGKLGFGNRWIVFVDAQSSCYRQFPPDRRRKRGINVSVMPLQRICDFKTLLVLDFAADGRATLRRGGDFCGSSSP